MAETWKPERKSSSWMKRDVRPWRSGEKRIKEKQGGRHRLIFKTWTALPWQQAGTRYTQKGFWAVRSDQTLQTELLTVSEVILDG